MHTAAAVCVLLGINCFYGEGWMKMANAIVHVLESGDDDVEDKTVSVLDALVNERKVRLVEFAAGVRSLEENGGEMMTYFPAVDLFHTSTLLGPQSSDAIAQCMGASITTLYHAFWSKIGMRLPSYASRAGSATAYCSETISAPGINNGQPLACNVCIVSAGTTFCALPPRAAHRGAYVDVNDPRAATLSHYLNGEPHLCLFSKHWAECLATLDASNSI